LIEVPRGQPALPSGSYSGEVREWLNRTVSKTVVPINGTVGSNPTLSADVLVGHSRDFRSRFRGIKQQIPAIEDFSLSLNEILKD
jgi:hypothetical protein